MAFNSTDYTKPPFVNGMDEGLTKEEILYVQAELKKVAEDLGVDGFTYDVLLGYCSMDRWEQKKWVNQDTAEYCYYYIDEEAENVEEEVPQEEA
jgi:hypothetical protein